MFVCVCCVCVCACVCVCMCVCVRVCHCSSVETWVTSVDPFDPQNNPDVTHI